MTVPEPLADKLRAARERLDALDRERGDALAERDRLIIEARAAGGSLREIAELIGTTHMAVQHVVQRDSTP